MARLSAGGFTLLCEETDSGLQITGYEGTDSRLIIPEGVVSVEKKAFLGCQGLKKIQAPESLRKLGNWCFAQCRNLENITIKAAPSQLFMERNAFEGCNRVSTLAIGYEDADDTAYLSGTLINRLPAQYLLTDPEKGEPGWFRAWDHSLISYLRTNDHEGFSERILCGEEDISYDGVGSVDGEMPGESAAYIKEIRMKKCYLCLLRLMHNSNLSRESQEVFTEYISHNEACWQVLKEEFGDDTEYFKLYVDTVKPDRQEIDRMLEDLGEGHTQAKAFLISFCRSSAEGSSGDAELAMFFDDLMI